MDYEYYIDNIHALAPGASCSQRPNTMRRCAGASTSSIRTSTSIRGPSSTAR